jgi:type IV pilus assembly protein PilM
MAKSTAVWGIDIGRCALKALRCHVDGDAVVADAFDYIEYPKLLTQPEADAPQLVKEALEQFLSRNNVKGDKVAVSVSGESGLARYFKPPPVDVKKIADIVKYEAKQQIPFALEDVIWDYQRMAGSQEVDGFAMDTEIGLFAMKREQVTKSLRPYDAAAIEVDVIQLAPIAIYNYFAYDVAKELPEGEQYSSENPPPSTVVLSIGTDTTDLVVTNGYRVWQRNIPLGGNHFTRQLSKELKLTFAKAEHLKRNPKQAEDPKAIFQAMRPVFADMVTEVQRSIGFFQSLDRKAKIANVVMLGNTVKLPGLAQYLAKHLGYEVKEVESFHKLGGSEVIASSSFKDNVLGFATCYGLCLQGLGRGKLSTNLLPREIITQRLIRAKKPWAVAGVSALVLACALNYVFYYNTWSKVQDDVTVNGVTWASALSNADQAKQESGRWLADDTKKKSDLEKYKKIGQEVVGSADRRVVWLEVMKAINESLPPMAPGLRPNMPPPDVKVLPFSQRRDLKIEYVESQFYPELSAWFNDAVKLRYLQQNPEKANAPADGSTPAPAAAPVAAAPSPQVVTMPGGGGDDMDAGYDPYGGSGEDYGGYGGYGGTQAAAAPPPDVSGIALAGPAGPGWVIELKGHHYYDNPKDRTNSGNNHVRNTLLKNLEHGSVDVPLGPGQPSARFSMKELGIGFAILAHNPIGKSVQIPNPNYVPPAGLGGVSGAFGDPSAASGFGSGIPGAGVPGQRPGEDPDNPMSFKVQRYDFIVQFSWIEKPLNVRLEERRKAQEAAAAAAAEQIGDQPSGVPGASGPPAGPGAPQMAPPAGQPAVSQPAVSQPAAGQPVAPPPADAVPPGGPGPANAPGTATLPPAGVIDERRVEPMNGLPPAEPGDPGDVPPPADPDDPGAAAIADEPM